jgi:hypothetical protein
MTEQAVFALLIGLVSAVLVAENTSQAACLLRSISELTAVPPH